MKRIMRSFRIDEISGVDRPAQVGARVALFKRDTNDEDHRSDKMTKEEIEKQAADIAAVEKSAAEAKTALEKQLTDAKAELELAKVEASLTDAEKAHASGLEKAAKDSFMKMDGAGRKAQLAKAADSNAVVYTAADGSEFRKNDDPRLVAMAKRNDENAKLAKTERELREDGQYGKRAEDELGSLPGTPEVLKGLLRAVDGIEDKTTRDGVTAALKAANDNLAKAFDRVGAQNAKGGDLDDQLETLSKNYAKAHNVTIEQARDKVLDTPEGSAIVAEMRS